MPTGRHELSDNAWRIQEFAVMAWDITPWLTFSPAVEYNQSISEEGGASEIHNLECYLPFTFILPNKWAFIAGYENKTDFENDNYVTHRAKIGIAKSLETVPLSFALSAKRDFDSGEKDFQVNFGVTYSSPLEMSNPVLVLRAPLSGVVYALERVPDAVFAQKLVGDGLSIDPTDSTLRAPCAGEVMHIHAASHALTLRAAGGVEVMMHIGIDTVALKGAGFTARVQVGDKVEAGASLIDFDLDQVATSAKSLLTQIVITNGDAARVTERASGVVKAGTDTLLTLTLTNGATASAMAGQGTTVTSDAIIIPNATGLHARPSAVLANVAKSFQSEVKLQRGDRFANARSVTSLMALEVARGDKVVLIAKGADAKEAVEKLSALIAQGLGDEGHAPAPAPATTTIAKMAEPVARPRSDDPNVLSGVAASPGLAVGTVFQVRHTEIVVEEDGRGVENEQHRLTDAIDKARGQLEALRAQLHSKADPGKAAIFAAHAELLDDPDFLEIANSAIAKGKSAAFAWKSAAKLHAERLANLRNELLAQRANDVRDVGLRVLELLTGVTRMTPQYAEGSILIAEDLTPSDTATMAGGAVVGFATVRGGATSHVAILARSLEIPAIAGIDPPLLMSPTARQSFSTGQRFAAPESRA